jgi:tricorn protease-like protein
MNIFICDDNAEQTSLCKQAIQLLSKKHGVHAKVKTFPSGERCCLKRRISTQP